MTIKEKFSSIDQSKLTADQKSFLDKIKNVTKNFSDAEMNKKVETPLDNFIAKAKEKMPEAVKSAPVKRTAKAKTSQTRKPKRTAMSLAKEIRKEGESWNDARARASKMMKEDSKDLSKTVETELDKLSKLVKSAKTRSKLTGISGTDIKRDAVRKAKPRGARRVTHSGETSNQYGTFSNKLGRKYYESRDRHSDRLAPNYPKNAPLLAEGAYLTDGTFGNFQNQVLAEGGDIDAFTLRMVKSNGMQPAEVLKEDTNVRYSRGGATTNERKHVNHNEDYEIRYAKPRPSRKGYKGVRGFAGGGRVESLTKELHRLQRDLNSSRLSTYREGDNSQEEKERKKEREIKLARFNEVLKELRESDAKFELGGTVVSDLAGNTSGGNLGLNPNAPLSGFSNTSYTGLVGETGAMSSGELFMAGGRITTNKEILEAFLDSKKELKVGNLTTHYSTLGDVVLLRNYGTLIAKRQGNKVSINSKKYSNSTTTITNLLEKLANNQGMKVEKISEDSFEHGGGLPHGAEQSYMITEALGNPAQHYATGGGIPNNYEGKSADEVWNDFTNDQKYHFLSDHREKIGFEEDLYNESKRTTKPKKSSMGTDIGFMYIDIDKIINTKYTELPRYVKFALLDHVRTGQYARGGGVKQVGNREYSYGRNWTNDHRHINKDENHEVKYNRKGKFLGIFKEGGNVANWVNYDKYHLINTENGMIVLKNTNLNDIQPKDIKGYDMLSNRGYNKGGSVTNERKHVNHDEDYEVRYAKPRASRKGYKGTRKFMAGGMNDESPRIYVADLEAYNNGKLVGEYLDLADYNDADELMDAIQDVLKKSGGEEYAIHDYENFPSSMYSEYMGQRDFEKLYEMMGLAKQNDLPLEVVQDVVSQYDASAVDEFVGKYDNAEDFAYEQVEEMGIESFFDFQYYLDVSDTDRRLLSQEMADSYTDDIRDEDGGNRIIEEAGLNVDEYEDASSETKEEMLDLATSMVNEEYYDNFYKGLGDPYYFLVEEQGLYDAESFAKANFVRVDYEKLGRDLEQDYTMIEYDGNVYVFNIR